VLQFYIHIFILYYIILYYIILYYIILYYFSLLDSDVWLLNLEMLLKLGISHTLLIREWLSLLNKWLLGLLLVLERLLRDLLILCLEPFLEQFKLLYTDSIESWWLISTLSKRVSLWNHSMNIYENSTLLIKPSIFSVFSFTFLIFF